MKVFGGSSKIQKLLEDERALKATYNRVVAKKIYQRINEIQIADDLTEVATIPPPRLHQLKGKRADQFSLDLTGNYRLIIKAYDENDDKTIDKEKVVAVEIVEVVDYH